MSDWTNGYVADIGYTYGYYPELNPLRAKFAFLSTGLAFPHIRNACELGFGQGVSINMHAAGSACTWHGTDFNPTQASFASDLASASGAPCQLSDQGFEEFCMRKDLPDFEFIGLHGVWSWISDQNRAAIVEFVRRKLKVGGVLYVSYNTQPGWASMVPVRHLLTEHAEVMAAPGRGIVSRIDAALDFADKFFELNPNFSKANPPVLERLNHMRAQNRHYLAHEYFNRDWEPMHFADVAKWLEPARISYACSANLLDHVRGFNMTDEQAAFLMDIPDQNFRETVRDFLVNQQFRRDYWVKGGRRISPIQQMETINELRVILLTPGEEISMEAQGPLGSAKMNEEIYRPLIEDLGNHVPVEVNFLFKQAQKRGVNAGQILQSLLILAGRGDISLVQDEETIQQAQVLTQSLNSDLLERARGISEVGYLASPLTGGGVPVSRTEQLFMHALKSGVKEPEGCAASAWQIMAALGQRLIKEGRRLDAPADNQKELQIQAASFLARKLPQLKHLGVA